MEQTFPDTEQPQRPSTASQFWRILRWTPLVAMLLVIASLSVFLFMGGMAKIAAWYLLQLFPPVLGLVFLVITGVYALVKRRFRGLPAATLLVALLSLSPVILMVVPVAYPASIASMTPSITVRLPADAPLRVLWGGDKLETNYHAIVPDQRWAYDLAVAPYLVGSAKLQDYGCYGVPVLAPVNGYVSKTHDGEPDATPGTPSNNFEAATGNHVVIRLQTDTYLVIAHLKPGSLLVKTGDTVKAGQAIGQCGNSGNTSEPHIHIHHQRQNPAVYPLNFAEGLPLYFKEHDSAPMPEGGIKIESDGKIISTGTTVRHIGKQPE